MIPKQFDAIVWRDFEDLVSSGRSEDRKLDYKQELPLSEKRIPLETAKRAKEAIENAISWSFSPTWAPWPTHGRRRPHLRNRRGAQCKKGAVRYSHQDPRFTGIDWDSEILRRTTYFVPYRAPVWSNLVSNRSRHRMEEVSCSSVCLKPDWSSRGPQRGLFAILRS